MRPWMRWASFFMMVLPAPILIHDIRLTILPMASFGVYSLSFFLFWAYSSPVLQMEKLISQLLSIFLSTGTNGFFFMGYFAGSGILLSLHSALAAFGVASILVSLYPISQLFQLDEDSRGDLDLAFTDWSKRCAYLLFHYVCFWDTTFEWLYMARQL